MFTRFPRPGPLENHLEFLVAFCDMIARDFEDNIDPIHHALGTAGL